MFFSKPSSGDRLELLCEPADDGGLPPIHKLRKVLKVLLRSFGTRCVSVEEMLGKASSCPFGTSECIRAADDEATAADAD